jgi:hypothetical protein
MLRFFAATIHLAVQRDQFQTNAVMSQTNILLREEIYGSLLPQQETMISTSEK